MTPTCHSRTPLDPITAAFFWRSKADRLLKVELEWDFSLDEWREVASENPILTDVRFFITAPEPFNTWETLSALNLPFTAYSQFELPNGTSSTIDLFEEGDAINMPDGRIGLKFSLEKLRELGLLPISETQDSNFEFASCDTATESSEGSNYDDSEAFDSAIKGFDSRFVQYGKARGTGYYEELEASSNL